MNNQWQKLEWAKLVYADLHFNPRCVLSIPACTSNIYSSKRVRHERQVPSLTQQYSISIPEKVNSDKVDRGRTPKCRNIRKFSELYVVTDDEMHPQNMQCHCRTTVTPLRPSPDHHLKGLSNEKKEGNTDLLLCYLPFVHSVFSLPYPWLQGAVCTSFR